MLPKTAKQILKSWKNIKKPSNINEIDINIKFKNWRYGSSKGFEVILPHSFPKAIREPEKVIQATKVPKKTSINWIIAILEKVPC